jgi:hypothetical protein
MRRADKELAEGLETSRQHRAQQRAYRLGRVRKMVADGMCDTDIGAALGVTSSGVRGLRVELGLPGNVKTGQRGSG